jgi:hypothetical protein
MSSVKVAVRVRPFNQREKDQNSVSIIDMDGIKTTSIRNPVRNQPKRAEFRKQEKRKILPSTTATGHTMSTSKKAIRENT